MTCLFQSVPDIRRIKITQTWLPRYFHQHFYIPVLYGLVRTSLVGLLDSYSYLLSLTVGDMENENSRLFNSIVLTQEWCVCVCVCVSSVLN